MPLSASHFRFDPVVVPSALWWLRMRRRVRTVKRDFSMRGVLQGVPRTEATAAMISLSVGITLLAIKFVAYFITESTAIYSDAVESIANVLGSAFAFYALIVAHRPADKDHPWGHGKIEFLSAWFEGGLILLAGVFIVVRTIEALWTGELLREQTLDLGLLLLVIAMVVNGLVGLMLLRVGKKQGSMALEADGRHLLTDVFTSAGVLAALIAVKVTGWKHLDPIAALAMAGYIGYTGIGLVRRSASGLMDEVDLGQDLRIRSILDAHVGSGARPPRICGYHTLRHRRSGRHLWIDFHVNIPGHTILQEAHLIASTIETELERTLGEASATVHIEDCKAGDCAHCVSGKLRTTGNE